MTAKWIPLVKASESSLWTEYANSNYSFLPPTQNVMAHSSFSIKTWPWNSLCEEARWGLFISTQRQNKGWVHSTFHQRSGACIWIILLLCAAYTSDICICGQACEKKWRKQTKQRYLCGLKINTVSLLVFFFFPVLLAHVTVPFLDSWKWASYTNNSWL